ncbi:MULTISPECIES: T9SS type A sorting domain-containing protein [unclassified Arcicella]|uniref:T9SS type A sorting domain-containing protein n=1 Tax=unclassified Arcicella TaxID=2644986 RepID=UPI002862C188|nr:MULTISPECIES: T9SS type A sorting domain-containing protein [unclassified Arcicella]MDR6562657.1 hypothetical protein [Arcicella sp. BE51]MDR6812744.1 hypothetical protein [Arcicella sp. BE140]MDR6824056.1 hypothetical protein [Arcicella sp. BE139]
MKKNLLLVILLLFVSFQMHSQRVYSVVFNQLPSDSQIYQRNDNKEATVDISGIIEIAGWDYMSVLVSRNSEKFQYKRSIFRYNDKGIGTFSLTPTIKAELADYNFEIYACKGLDSILMVSRKNISAGEVFLINGQSNGAAYNVNYFPYSFTNKYCRTFGLPQYGKAYTEADILWTQSDYSVGTWGLELQRLFLEKYKMPSCIINGSVHGTQIDLHQRNDSNPTNIYSIYGRLLYRAQKAHVDKNFRALFFWQGENDIAENEPENWPTKFDKLFNSWRQDYANLNKYYIFQINSIAYKKYGSGTLRDYQRKIQEKYAPFIESIATVGNNGYDGAHYTNEGYIQFANEIFRRLERDFYGVKFVESVSSPSIKKIFYTTDKKNEIALVFDEDQKMLWKNDTLLTNNDGSLVTQYMKNYFLLDNKLGEVVSGKADKNKIILTLKSNSTATKLTYLLPYFPYDDTEKRGFFGGPYLQNNLGVKALTFQDVKIEDKDPDAPTKLPNPQLVAVPVFYNKVNLSWQSILGATKYVLERQEQDKPIQIIKTLDNTVNSYTDSTLNQNTSYTYRIQALNETISSDYAIIAIKTPSMLEKPILNIEIISTSVLKIKWNTISNATSYILERKSGADTDFIVIQTLANNVSEFTDTNLKANTLYSYRIKAFGDKTASQETISNAQTPIILAMPNLKALEITHESIQLQWEQIALASKYILERKTIGDTDFKKIFESENLLTFTDAKLKDNQNYLYRLKAINAFSESQFSTIELKTNAILAIDSQEKNLIKIYPNPVNSILQIQLPKTNNYIVSILDFLGNKVFEKTILNQNLFSLDLSTLKKGLYLVIINNNQEIYSSKFILE